VVENKFCRGAHSSSSDGGEDKKDLLREVRDCRKHVSSVDELRQALAKIKKLVSLEHIDSVSKQAKQLLSTDKGKMMQEFQWS